VEERKTLSGSGGARRGSGGGGLLGPPPDPLYGQTGQEPKNWPLQITKQLGSTSQSLMVVPVQLKILPLLQRAETWQGAQFLRTPSHST
jgi:hypothetical protein